MKSVTTMTVIRMIVYGIKVRWFHKLGPAEQTIRLFYRDDSDRRVTHIIAASERKDFVKFLPQCSF